MLLCILASSLSSVVSVRVELKRRLSDAFLAAVFQATAAAAQANLLKQQEELERKAAELDRREQELQTRQSSSGQSTCSQRGDAVLELQCGNGVTSIRHS